jgi:hypothetical protein
MEGPKTWLGVSVPRDWAGVVSNGVATAVVAFAALLLKEWFETREWDVPACAVDGTCVGGAVLLLHAILKSVKG